VLYEECVENGWDFGVRIDIRKQMVHIKVSGESSEELVEHTVEGSHCVAAFALLVLESHDEPEIILVDKKKGIWPYDVPGGKVEEGDSDWSATLRRELIEELSFYVNSSVTFEPTIWTYDPKSQKEGVPVIAGYTVHHLSDDEAKYVRTYLIGDLKQPRTPLITIVPVSSLLKSKEKAYEGGNFEEVECHAPLKAFKMISPD
jgi:8-oxo-dGTP pyrophosphatase MutT (NUDIX family)